MNYLFWNTNRNKINNYLKSLIIELNCDIVVLAEYKDDINTLLTKLTNENFGLYHVPKIGCQRIDILTKYTPGLIEHFAETSYYTIKKIPHDKLGFHNIGAVHFPSKLHMTKLDYLIEMINFKKDLEKAENNLSNNNTIVVGDFNMNPFEEPLIAATGMHSLSSKRIAKTYERTVKGRKHSMFYNPMWNFFGDSDNLPGTYFYNNSKEINYFWNIFDQVIIRPNLIENFDEENIMIVNKIGNINLLGLSNRPDQNISDHLPLFFSIN
ncbi:endonuclease/exonuclease/phosphatase family protein [Halanaerobium hydrogeniformans]|uniref:Endonuclease/exonuclease/phosphatase n=1 Tax=Halanaerobium hydrogeniformans TaxID=656519 RepID=E4RKY6_HALHG|nr:endonuclease/exonuclease/phosphatase family protein [Halanaerobium hydrogeniformans]ADQ15727.1 Endonuclease/exonuclease/phosphatase [Halanaerobium hydrogeniformans]